jgi:hypothetical protein
MQKVRKTAHELEAIVRAEAARVIGPWPVGLRLLIFPLGDTWRATFSLEHSGVADYRDDVLPIILRLRNGFDIIEALAGTWAMLLIGLAGLICC